MTTNHSAGISFNSLPGEISDLYKEVYGVRPHSLPLTSEHDLRAFYNSLVDQLEEMQDYH